jgi:hypothetical protein
MVYFSSRRYLIHPQYFLSHLIVFFNALADLFIRLAGFGNAAGLLAMRDLFGMGANLKGY